MNNEEKDIEVKCKEEEKSESSPATTVADREEVCLEEDQISCECTEKMRVMRTNRVKRCRTMSLRE